MCNDTIMINQDNDLMLFSDDITDEQLMELQEQLWATEAALYDAECELFGDEYADHILAQLA